MSLAFTHSLLIDNIEVAIYTDPTERAMYGMYRLYIEYYFAPTRLYQAWLHNNKEYIGEDMSKVKLPIMDITANGIDPELTEEPDLQQISPSSLLAHLGVRSLGQHVNGYRDNPNVRAIFNAETMLAYYDIGKKLLLQQTRKIRSSNRLQQIGCYKKSIYIGKGKRNIESIWYDYRTTRT